MSTRDTPMHSDGEDHNDTFRIDTSNSHAKEVAGELLRAGYGTEQRVESRPLQEIEQLNEYSRRFAQRLFHSHPEWRADARVSTDYGALLVNEVCPATHGQELWICTEEEELTVGFGQYFHTHFSSWDPESESRSFERALQFVDELIHERILIVVAMRGESWAGSWVQRPGERLQFPDRFTPAGSPGLRILVYSWRSSRHLDAEPLRAIEPTL